jgi:hypothetical protein
MAIKTGRYGKVLYDPLGVTPVEVVALNSWKASFAMDFEEVTCFGDENKVYVPGLPDVSGSLGGFWDSTSVVLFEAAKASTPGMLQLIPNTTEPTYLFEGLAYITADIDCSLAVPKFSGTFKAAGPWVMEP